MRKSNNYRDKTNFAAHNRPTNQDFSILPPLALLESYEELAPGITKQLAKMMQLEQQSRHHRQNLQMKANNITTRFGQVLNLLTIILILYSTVLLSRINIYLAASVCASGFLFLLLVHFKAMKYCNQENNRKKLYKATVYKK